MVDVDPQDLAEQHVDVLRIVRRIVRRSAVADADVEIAVGPERQHAAVVIGGRRMRNGEEHVLAGVGDVAIRRHAIFGHDDRAVVRPRVIDEEPAIRRVSRMKCQTQQPPLAAGENPAPDIEKDRGCRRARLQDAHIAGLLDDEQPVGAVACMADEHRTCKAAGHHRHQRDRGQERRAATEERSRSQDADGTNDRHGPGPFQRCEATRGNRIARRRRRSRCIGSLSRAACAESMPPSSRVSTRRDVFVSRSRATFAFPLVLRQS